MSRVVKKNTSEGVGLQRDLKIELAISKDITRLLVPKPVVLVTCVSGEGKPNIITVGAIQTASQVPPMFMIAIHKSRYSNHLISQNGEFVINIPCNNLVEAVEFCGKNSGRTLDKFKATGLTPTPAKTVKPPLIGECPINIECRVVTEISPGSHTLFIGQVVAAHARKRSVRVNQDQLFVDLEECPIVAYSFREYRSPGSPILRASNL